MSQTWIAFEYDHEESQWLPSVDYRKAYRAVGHIKAALTCVSNSASSWEIASESANEIQCESVRYITNPALPRLPGGWPDEERVVLSGMRLVFMEVTSKLNGSFPKPPKRPS